MASAEPVDEKEVDEKEVGENIFSDTRPVKTRLWEIRNSYKYLMIVYISAIGIGIDSLLFSLLLGMESFRKAYGYYDEATSGWVIRAKYQSGWNGGSFGCQVLGAFFAGWYNDKFGRKSSLAISCIITIIGNTVAITAPVGHPINLVMAKCVIGIGIGILVSTCPVYLSELMSPTLRGIGSMGINFSICFGQWIGSLIYFGCSKNYTGIDDSTGYKIAFGIQYLLVGGYLLLFWFMPESPSYLIHRGKLEEAKAAIKKLYHNKNNTEYDIDSHYEILIKEVEEEKMNAESEKEVSYAELFKATNLKRVVLSIFALTGQLWVGVSSVLTYISYFFELAGVSSSIEKTVGMFTLCVGGNLVSYFVIERVDRRVLYIGGVALCTIMNLLIACVSYGSSQAAAYTTVVFVFLWAFIYEATVGPLTYALITELPQGRMRAKSVAITSNVNSLCSFGLGYLIPYLFNPDEVNMGARIMFVWTGTGVVLFVVMLFFLPETRGRTANEIEQLFVNKVGALKFKRAKFDEDDKLIMSSVGKEVSQA
ncbi:hypothetical protein FOA43_003225 [Brettanomyces nanus]|uniref:Major facilitator superfamily (MFS) profile domain-containing protein n=1 Tax=Eeniella nana TaxID=13502 RepID=A0A875S7C4_EENNA|nr:uncharacterized protein FOA43_003225 [Brettanomyces nanus]QPG75842.1 hypothetical protein FOA43_003225 [Brettanomyces nanus]